MSTRTTVEIDRKRIAELTKREQKRLDEPLPHQTASARAQSRAHRQLPFAR